MQRHQDQTHQNLFRASKAEADGLKRAHDALLQERADRLRKLHENHRQSQLEEYLDRFEIATARIKGIGPAKVTILQSYGIETALDVNQQRVLGISGFGPKTVANLLAWRQTCEQSFRFDPQKGVSPTEVAAVEQDVMLRVRGLEARLAKTLEELKTHAANEQRRRADCATKIAGVGRVYGQLYADVQAATRAFC
jgi:DNA-binding helix-hairpin-helix protein with protein kinase domain